MTGLEFSLYTLLLLSILFAWECFYSGYKPRQLNTPKICRTIIRITDDHSIREYAIPTDMNAQQVKKAYSEEIPVLKLATFKESFGYESVSIYTRFLDYQLDNPYH